MSLPITIAFDITDDVAARATWENWLALGRHIFSPSTLGLIAASIVVFVLSLRLGLALLWLVLAGIAPASFAIMLILWAVSLWWARRATGRRLARLLHRHVTIQLTDAALIIVTANERFELKWIGVRELRELPHFLLIVLTRGSEIPLPRDAVSIEAREWLQSKLTPP